MSQAARVGRLVLVALVFGLGAWVVDALLQQLVPVLVLPPVFMGLARAAMALTLLVLLAATWVHGAPRDREGPRE